MSQIVHKSSTNILPLITVVKKSTRENSSTNTSIKLLLHPKYFYLL